MFLHGAGTGTATPLFTRLGEVLVAAGVDVARLEMPYRVAGRRAPDRPARLDSVLTAVTAVLGRPRPLALAGASMGARVACRTARAVGAVGVLALGFPLSPPRRQSEASRQGELDGTGVPVLVVQGERDAFGVPRPDPARGVELHVVTGADHSFRTRRVDGRSTEDAVAEAASTGGDWLLRRLACG
jgi:predicted alpha/beta-hydrolase family hydrolase